MSPRPAPVHPQQCEHKNTYYDASGLRCKDCHKLVRRYPPAEEEEPFEVPLEKEFPDLWYPLDTDDRE